MRKVLLLFVFPLLFTRDSSAQTTATNLLDILPHLDVFCRALELDTLHPLSVSNVTRWVPYRGPFPPPLHGTAHISIGTHAFAWEVRYGVVWAYRDGEHAASTLYKSPEKTPDCLLAVERGASVMTTNEAVTLAELIRGRLAAIGYSTNTCGAIKVTRPLWSSDPKEVALPFYNVEWAWSKKPDTRYMEIEIDGLRRKPNHFFTLQGSPSERGMQGERMPWSEPDQ